MISKSRRIVIILAVFIVGWSLGYLSLPYIPNKDQFWIGALSAIAAFIFFFLIRGRILKQKKRSGIILLITLIAFTTTSLYLFSELVQEQKEANFEAEEILVKTEKNELQMIYAQERIDQRRMVDKTLKQIEFSLENTDTTLSVLRKLIGELEVLEIYINDSSKYKLSPGKGHLLTTILKLDLQKEIYDVLIDKLDFSYSDLNNADLKNAEFIGMNLKGSNLNKANLEGVKFRNSDLSKCLLYEAQLDNSTLLHCQIVGAYFDWSSMNNSNFTGSDLTGSQIKSSSLLNSVLDSADMKWTVLNNSNFKGSSLIETDLWSAQLIDADLSNCNLTDSRLHDTKLYRCNLNGSNLDGSAVTKEWIKKVKKYKPLGLDYVLESFEVRRDSSERFKYRKYFIKAKRSS
ncbi:MAG: hypothetical protein CMP59_05375 [Flavobacteriales bacterium]|nr:hypothetical protein [Flavobacteriales bacterium]